MERLNCVGIHRTAWSVKKLSTLIKRRARHTMIIMSNLLELKIYTRRLMENNQIFTIRKSDNLFPKKSINN